MAYITLKELGDKYNLSLELRNRMLRLIEDEFPQLVFGNPDISASGVWEQNIVKAENGMRIIARTITPNDTASVEDVKALRTIALHHMATYIAEYNKLNYVDFITDCRLDPDFKSTECPRSGFGVDAEEISDFIFNTMGDELEKAVGKLQK